MTTDISIMKEMLERATNPSENVDELGVQMFCMVAKNNVQKAQEMIVSKVQSRNVVEATRAIALLEECMAKCGSEFQDQIGKFRFLNYLIRLVSKKYEGADTPQAIKQRIMECLLLWTTAFPQKEKIREAYDNLNKEGDVDLVNTVMNVATLPAKPESILGNDEELLKKLVQSKDPEDYKRANLLIQYRVNQEARRNEFRAQQKHELLEVSNIANLLSQMLDTYESDGKKDLEGTETMNLIRELYLSCKRHKPIILRLIELNESTDDDLIGEVLDTNDALLAIMKRYKSTIIYQSNKNSGSPTSNLDSNNTTTDLLAALLEDVPSAPLSGIKTTATNNNLSSSGNTTSKTLDELNEIFGHLNTTEEKVSTPSSAMFCNHEVLEPLNVKDSPVKNLQNESQQSEKRSLREMREINELSEELFKKNLPTSTTRIGSFKKDPEKLSLNDLVKEQINASVSLPSHLKDSPIESNVQGDILITEKSIAETEAKFEVDDLMLDGTENNSSNHKESIIQNNTIDNEVINPNSISAMSSTITPHLSDISIDLDDILATTDERVIHDDDDIRITLSFTENRPSKYISVIVISIENKNKFPIKDLQFEASVKKPNKIRLLPPSDISMPPFKRFRPPTPINQIMLLLNPTEKPIDVTCIVGYKIGDDPDPIKESILVKDLPFVK